jgi:signal recognition particle subunit SRP54
MGDILSLVEKAQQVFDEKEALALEKKFRENDFNLEDFLTQMKQIRKMGPIKNIIGMLPGMNQIKPDELDVDDKIFVHMEAIINSMTVKERRNPAILNSSRKRRVAKGSGRTIQEVNKLVRQFDEMKKIMKDLTGMTGKGKKGKLGLPFMKF